MRTPLPRFLILPGLLLASAALLSCESMRHSVTGASDRDPSVASQKQDAASREAAAVEASARKTAEDARAGATAASRDSSAPSADGMIRREMAFPTGNAATSAVLLKKRVPASVQLERPFEYFLEVTNLTDHNLEDVVVSDRLPKDFTVSGSTPAHERAEDGTARWVFAKLGPNATQTIRVAGVAKSTASIASCTSVEYDSRICTTIAVVQPSLKLTKSAPASALLCDGIPVEYVVTNTGTGVARDVTIREELPENLRTKDRKPLQFVIRELAPGKSEKFEVQLDATARGTYASKATATASGDLTAASLETKTVVYEPVLEVSAKGPETVFLGRDVTYEITVKNVGDTVARNTRIEESLPVGVRFVSASHAGRPQRDKIEWSLGELQPETERTVSFTVRADVAGQIRCTTKASARCAREVSAAATSNMVGIPAILLEVVDVEDPIAVGGLEDYQIRVTNQGTAPGTGIKIVCTLEETMEFVSATGATRGVLRGQQVEFPALATLAPKAEAMWTVRVKSKSAGDVRFKVSMTSDQTTRPVEETEATNFYK